MESVVAMSGRRARDTLLLRSPSLHLNLTRPHPSSPILTGLRFALSAASPLLTCLAWDLLIPGRAAVESVNSWREKFRGARTGSKEFALISILERRSHSIGKLL
jgi:hypothetical protein